MKLEHNTERVWLDNDIYIELLNNEWEHCPFPDFDQLFYNRQRAEVEQKFPSLKGLADSNEDYQLSWRLPASKLARRKIIKQLLNR
jgi:hypothetical protein